MQLLRLVVISELLVLAGGMTAGCITPPEKPVVLMCSINYPQDAAICGNTDSEESVNLPLRDLDRATAFKPADWEKIQNYVSLMEEYVKNQCQR